MCVELEKDLKMSSRELSRKLGRKLRQKCSSHRQGGPSIIDRSRDVLMLCLAVATHLSSNPTYALRLTARIRNPDRKVFHVDH